MKFFLNNGDEYVGRHAAPNLRLERVLAVAQKLFDTPVLFDPFEEQLYLPTAFAQSSTGQGRQGRVVGQDDQSLLGCWILEPDTAQALWPSQLGKIHDAKLLRASQAPHARVVTIPGKDARKACPWNEPHDLREQGLADINRNPPRSLSLGNYTKMKKRVSNLHQKNLPLGNA